MAGPPAYEFSTPESSIGDNDSARFENDDDSSATEDLFTPDEHEKNVHFGGKGGHGHHRESRTSSQSRLSRQFHPRRPRAPEVRNVYPGPVDHKRSDPQGVVDLIPSRSMHRPRLERSMSMSHPAEFHPKPATFEDRDRGAYRRSPSPSSPPLSPQSLSPPVKYMQGPFAGDLVREKDWNRQQRDAERLRHEYVRNRRLQEKEEELEQRELDLVYREMRFGRTGPAPQGPSPPRKRSDRFPAYPPGRFDRDHAEHDGRIRFEHPHPKFM